MTPTRLTALAVALTVTAALATSCTSGESETTTDAETADPPASTAPVIDLVRANAPLSVSIVQLGGGVPRSERSRLVRQVSRPIATWIDGAFVEGAYPRVDFSSGFSSWTSRAATLAARDRQVTTNAALGRDVVAVVADEQVARLFVFASQGRTGGATAEVSLRLTQQRRDSVLTRVRVTGELYLTRLGNRWSIFGYDLQRSESAR